MAIEPGTHLGHFEIVAPLGRGGMGEVYRAHDSHLSREVALKFLPDALSRDPDRAARFEREARVLASLNHAHIASVYGFEQADSRRFLVLELVNGQTLADRLSAGPMEWREALKIARQLAEALEEAHSKGVIHRDLKPANVKITPEGRVKVLDFGLAKVLSDAAPVAFPMDSPTMIPAGDSAGLILGTAGYMSPEQARGQTVDKRTDIWAFGCVLFEMLSGRQLFAGVSTTDVLSAILTTEPDWGRLPSRTPPGIRSLLRKCLQKDKAARLHDIADARLEIDEALSVDASGMMTPSGIASAPSMTVSRRFLPYVLVFLSGILVGAAATYMAVRPQSTGGVAARFNIALPAEGRLTDFNFNPVHISADATRLAYVGRNGSGQFQIFIRRMDRLAPEPIPGTEMGQEPFLSPDGEWLGFAQEGKLKRVALSGGQPIVICDAPDPRGASWGDDNTILVAPSNAGGLFRVRAFGGPLEAVTKPDPARQEDGHRWPRLLPGGKVALFSVQPVSGRESQRTIEALNLSTGERRTLVRGGSYPVYANGLLFFGRSGQILALPFSPERLEVTGEPRVVVDDVRMEQKTTGLAYFDVSATGTAIYVAGFIRPRERSLVFMDRTGVASSVTAAKRPFWSPALSPDGRRVAVTIQADEDALWVLDIASGTFNRLTFAGDADMAQWSADGRSLIYTSNVDGPRGVYRIAADGTGKPELLFERNPWWINEIAPRPDGSGVLIAAQDVGGHDLYFVPSTSQKPEPFLVTPTEERDPQFSPNGAFVAYQANESGRMEAYVRAFSEPGSKRQVSTNSGVFPSWSHDGRDIFYWQVGSTARLMNAPFESGKEVRIGAPRFLFEVPLGMLDRINPTPDGQRFLMIQPEPEQVNPLEVVVIPTFLDEIRTRVRFTGTR